MVRVGLQIGEDQGESVVPGESLLIRRREKENAKDTLCRNVTIYGHCRYEEKGGEMSLA